MSDANIILTGFMGTGKTTVGKLLAERLGYTFVDTDVLIERRSGRTVAEVFSQLGEGAFRWMERSVAADLAARSQTVVATGGGMLLDPTVAAVLGDTGRIFCLTASPEQILQRVVADEKRIARPLLQVSNPRKKILALLAARQALYAQFEQVLTDGISAEKVAQTILDTL